MASSVCQALPCGSGDAYDVFGFQARDGPSASNEGTVTVNVDASTCSEAAPVGGAAGLAAEFDGATTCASLGKVNASSAAAGAGVSVRVAFKTASVAGSGSTVLAVGPLRLGWTRLKGLSWGLESGRGLHSFTSQRNRSVFDGIGGARRDCVARDKGVSGGVYGVQGVFVCHTAQVELESERV